MSLAQAYATVTAGLHAEFPIISDIPQELRTMLAQIDEKHAEDDRLQRITTDALLLKTGFWYLASPYAKYHKGHTVAFEEAARLGGELLARGIFCFVPIAHLHPYATYAPSLTSDAANHSVWMPFDKQFVDAAVGIIVADMEGWQESKGVGMEIAWTREAGKPMWLLNPETLTLSRMR